MSRNETITLVVVCYERELNMLALLARSVATHASDDLLTEILIIDNSIGQPDFAHRIEARAMSEFGRFRTRAKILSATDLGVVVAGTGGGYTSQQALKLEVSRVVSTDYYLLFDAKNHLATRLDASELFAADGRPLAERTIHTDYLAACQRASFEFWGATAAPEAPTLPTVTPYLMVTHVVRRMLDEIESRGRSVQETIAEDTKRTEFLLYAGYLERDGAVDTTYGSRSRASATLYARWPQDNPTIERVIASAGTAGAYAMGVHARRFVQLQDRHIELIARRWLDFGIVDSIESGAAFIRAEARGDETAD
ncbi:MAG: hypothetical protein K0R99_4817, partial [Microbacterium sp.]|nr:hypothetical protein [Microbacterium sp.]